MIVLIGSQTAVVAFSGAARQLLAATDAARWKALRAEYLRRSLSYRRGFSWATCSIRAALRRRNDRGQAEMALRSGKRRSGSSCWKSMLHAAARSRITRGGAQLACTTRLGQLSAVRVYGLTSTAGAPIFRREFGVRD
jgi:hypothetical protein